MLQVPLREKLVIILQYLFGDKVSSYQGLRNTAAQLSISSQSTKTKT